MDNNKLKEAVLDMCMQFSFDQSEDKSIMQHTDKLYSLISDVAKKLLVEVCLEVNEKDAETLFNNFIQNIYNQS